MVLHFVLVLLKPGTGSCRLPCQVKLRALSPGSFDQQLSKVGTGYNKDGVVTQLTVPEVLVYLITNKWAHAKDVSTSPIAS